MNRIFHDKPALDRKYFMINLHLTAALPIELSSQLATVQWRGQPIVFGWTQACFGHGPRSMKSHFLHFKSSFEHCDSVVPQEHARHR